MTIVRLLGSFLLPVALFLSFAFWCSDAFAQARAGFVSDAAFGNHGLVTGRVGPVSLSASLSPRVFAKDKRGRVIVGAASGSRWRVWRILPNGEVDSSFGEQGEVVITRWGPHDLTDYSPASAVANLTSAVIRPDGRILLAGYLGSYAAGDIRKGIAIMVMKQLMPDGSPDETFGQTEGGKGAGSRSGAARVALRPDGGFLVGAFKQKSETGRTDDGALLSFTADGRMERDFGAVEKLNGVYIPGAPRKPSYVFDVEVLRGGRILVTGVSKNRLLLMRLHRDGSPDLSFGRKGRVTLLPGGRKETFAAASREMEIDKKGRIVVTGFVYPRDAEKADYGLVMRFRRNGRLDRSFGKRGIVRLYATPRRGEERSTRLYGVSIDSTGGIWAVGSAGRSARNQRRAIVARFLPNGRKDRRFFKKGILRIGLGNGSTGSGLLRAGRKMYVSGRYDRGDRERFFLKRLKLHR